jgi:3-dehydroquinate synthetase
LHTSDLWDFTPPKRFALLVCLLHQATVATRDEIVQMFIIRMRKLKTRAKEELERLRTGDRTTTKRLIEVFTDVLQANTDTQDVTEAGTQIRAVLDIAGGTAHLLEQCEHISAHHGDRYQPLDEK